MLIQGDARNIPLADGSVQCVVTSPPYWGLRDYGVAGQIGLEPTPEAYIATMVDVFREVKRVLRDDGTLWLNLGDSYAANRSYQVTDNKRVDVGNTMGSRVPNGLKPKDLCGMPWRIAFALQTDGWYLRADIIWAKHNPMPESATDRPTRSHEFLFLLTKSERYYYDADAIREDAQYGRSTGGFRGEGAYTNNRSFQNGSAIKGNTQGHSYEGGRNKRDVWTINSEPTPEAHFATFPQKLIEPCILAGTSEKGCCSACGAPRVRMVEKVFKGDGNPVPYEGRPQYGSRMRMAGRDLAVWKHANPDSYRGWRLSCECTHCPVHDFSGGFCVGLCPDRSIPATVPCIVFDPFIGSGTVGNVCERLGRRWIGLELSSCYIEIAKKRTSQMGLFL